MSSAMFFIFYFKKKTRKKLSHKPLNQKGPTKPTKSSPLSVVLDVAMLG
jgi:hypothetical protein